MFNSSSGNGKTIHYLYMTNNEPELELQMTNEIETRGKK
jgi:hypothetical protein